MKFTSKFLAAAVAAIAAVGSAHASGVPVSTSPTGSLLLYVWDANTPGQGYVLDTGLTYGTLLSDAASNTSVTVNAAGSSIFQGAFSASDISAGLVDFTVITGESPSTGGVQNAVAITSGLAAPSWLAGGTIVAGLLSYQVTTTNNLSATSAESIVSGSNAGNGNAGLTFQDAQTQNNNNEITTLGAVTTANLYSSVSNPNTGSGRSPILNTPTVSQLFDANGSADTITLAADGAVIIGGTPLATPLPAAVWLFGSGLLGLFGIGRRRNSANV